MSAHEDVAVRVDGLAALRRDLRAMDRDLGKELTSELKAAVEEIVLPAARALTPRRSGKLAASLRAAAAGNKASVRSSLPYANVIHWGGTTGRGHERGANKGSVHVNPSKFVVYAVDARENEIVESLATHIEGFAKRHGWH